MNYELAKKLKDAGFPQGKTKFYWAFGRKGQRLHYKLTRKQQDSMLFVGVEVLSAPTLLELIEACGNKFAHLKRYYPSGIWEAATDGYEQQGSTPEEAVANLWISLHPKKDEK